MEPNTEQFTSARIYKKRMQEIVEFVKARRKKHWWERVKEWYNK